MRRANLAVVFILMTVLSVFSVVASENGEDRNAEILTKEQQNRLLALLPDLSALELELVRSPNFYVTDNLHDYINGAADIFFQYDFENLIAVEYKQGEVELTLDIYNMGTLLNAFGIYSAERSPSYTFTPIGVQGSISEYGLNFLQGSYYVKLSAFGPEETVKSLLPRFAEAVSARIGRIDSFPTELQLFLDNRKIANSEKFVRKNPLGYEFLGPTFLASYQLGETESLLAITPSQDENETQRKLEALKTSFQKGDDKIRSIYVAGSHGIEIDSHYRGKMYVLPVHRYLLILRKPGETALTFLADHVSYLRTKDKQLFQNEQ
ncbi:MAG: hypothetical protein C4527_20900 [Candidatus Omnitrophota bacterium]|jgi:hypothetical protein|nr:MAG: hypothetical protein C4527_20900 [Candidatus Omnitrophota bacterium]